MDLKIKIGWVTFKNPVWVASGTFGNAEEFREFLDPAGIRDVVTKTLTLNGREGNPPPRIVETASGILNAIGLENKGIARFKKENYPFLKKLKTRIIISIAGTDKKEIAECAGAFSGRNEPDAIEVNLSCPNVTRAHGPVIAQDARRTKEAIAAVKRKVKCPVIAKLSPNVTSIASIAAAAEAGGADAIALVNTYAAMAVDAEEMTPILGNVTGGLSGPAIKPMALKAVRDAYHAVTIPVIGMGGVMTGTDIAEFMLCGATAVAIGTANLADPAAHSKILAEFKRYLRRKKIKRARELTGALKDGRAA
ncbi:MAG: dihydroorotate dehydrogenase [Candidatus Omnitrophota bacterium]